MDVHISTDDGGILQALNDIKQGPRRQILQKAMRFAIKPLPAKVKAQVPRETGTLRKAIGTKVTAPKIKPTVAGIVGARRMPNMARRVSSWGVNPTKVSPTRYAHLVDKGTKAHSLTSDKYRVFGVNRGSRTIAHPGAQAKPFLATVAASSSGGTVKRFVENLKAQYDQAWNKAIANGKSIIKAAGSKYSRAARGYVSNGS